MLALSRKKGESIILNNDIELTILEVKGDQVKIGVNAPKSVPVYRKEVYLQIQQENREAAAEYARQSLKDLLKP
ncbi:MAG: carbon storage regulator CsrA [Lachnospiraceae bacterium]|nr:carbon storage regulator CsrA [Lachnospiraceae bacterium]